MNLTIWYCGGPGLAEGRADVRAGAGCGRTSGCDGGSPLDGLCVLPEVPFRLTISGGGGWKVDRGGCRTPVRLWPRIIRTRIHPATVLLIGNAGRTHGRGEADTFHQSKELHSPLTGSSVPSTRGETFSQISSSTSSRVLPASIFTHFSAPISFPILSNTSRTRACISSFS